MSVQGLFSVDEAKALIESGRVLLVAGEAALLSQLPAGKWIGGTAANFMSAQGGVTDQERIFVTDISEYAADVSILSQSPHELRKIGTQYPANGFAVIILPGLSDIHATFAKDVQDYEGVFNIPLVGWISGVVVSDIGRVAPQVFAGNGTPSDNKAAVMLVTLHPGMIAHTATVNLFKQGQGEVIEFKKEGFLSEGDCLIGGKPGNLSTYIIENNIDTKLPLVADYNGAMVNVSIQSVHPENGTVKFYAPVFRGTPYRFAEPVTDYASRFDKVFDKSYEGNVAFSCNCILNYLYAGLEGKKTGFFVGPITFGEVAYILLNQTLVYLSIDKLN